MRQPQKWQLSVDGAAPKRPQDRVIRSTMSYLKIAPKP
jgi:hypothetical protein